jgi:predicted flavoprotein YhiN
VIRNNCEHKTLKNLYFTGELLDIDAITGGFNFQGCWTTAHTVAMAIDAKENI